MWIRITFCHYCTYLILTHFQSSNTMQIFSLRLLQLVQNQMLAYFVFIFVNNELRRQMMFLQISYLWNVTHPITSFDRVVGRHFQKNKESLKVPNTPKTTFFWSLTENIKSVAKKFLGLKTFDWCTVAKFLNDSTSIFPNVSFVSLRLSRISSIPFGQKDF